jgi:hypothetical protein
MQKQRRKYVNVVITADVKTKKLIDVGAFIGEGSETEVTVEGIFSAVIRFGDLMLEV